MACNLNTLAHHTTQLKFDRLLLTECQIEIWESETKLNSDEKNKKLKKKQFFATLLRWTSVEKIKINNSFIIFRNVKKKKNIIEKQLKSSRIVLFCVCVRLCDMSHNWGRFSYVSHIWSRKDTVDPLNTKWANWFIWHIKFSFVFFFISFPKLSIKRDNSRKTRFIHFSSRLLNRSQWSFNFATNLMARVLKVNRPRFATKE